MSTRNQSLDVLRGLAILMVLGRHGPNYFHFWHEVGSNGVHLFFTLSGFLIAGLLFTEYKRSGRIDFKRFFIRRGLKIYPPYYFFLLILLPLTFRHLRIADFIFMQSYWPYFWGHGWSLAVEEHFYLALPLLLILSLKLRPKDHFSWIPYAVPIITLGCLLVRIRYGFDCTLWTHSRADALFDGVAIAWFYHFHRERFHSPRWLLAMTALFLFPMCLLKAGSYAMATVGLLSNSIAFSFLLIWAVNSRWLGKLSLISRIGFYSYSIYLWHWPLGVFAQRFPATLLNFTIYVIAACALGILMAKVVEIPVLRIRDRYFPSRSIDLAAVTSGREQSSSRLGGAEGELQSSPLIAGIAR